MKHFTEPMTALIDSLPSFVSDTSDPMSEAFLQFVRARLVGDHEKLPTGETWFSIDVPKLVTDARAAFRRRARALRIGLHLVSVVRRICLVQDEDHEVEDVVATVEALIEVLKGRSKTDVKYLGTVLK